MYRSTDLRSLATLKAWRQNFNNQEFEIDTSLTISDFGQYYQDVHPLLTLDNIKAIAPDFDKVTFPTWLVSTSYITGDKVVLNNVSYEALQDNTGQDPESTSGFWSVFDVFSDWLKQKTEASTLKLIDSIHNEKLADLSSKNLIENKMLFDIAGRIGNTLDNTDSLVGFEIIPIRAKGVTLKINKIGLQFTGTIEDLTVYLMHSSSNTPIRTLTLVRTLNNTLEWFDPTADLLLPYDSSTIDAGGSWYLVYDQRTLASDVKAIIKERDWSKTPCRSCSSYEYTNWLTWSKYLEIYPFKTNNQTLPAGSLEMWDISSNIYTLTSNYGLNLEVTVMCDTTDIMKEQKKSFESAIGLQVACDFIRAMAHNADHKIERTTKTFSKQELLYELDGDSQSYKKSGLLYDLNLAKKALKIDLNKLSRVCYSCKNGGVRYKAI